MIHVVCTVQHCILYLIVHGSVLFYDLWQHKNKYLGFVKFELGFSCLSPSVSLVSPKRNLLTKLRTGQKTRKTENMCSTDKHRLAVFLREMAFLFLGATSLSPRLAGAMRDARNLRCGCASWTESCLSCYTCCSSCPRWVYPIILLNYHSEGLSSVFDETIQSRLTTLSFNILGNQSINQFNSSSIILGPTTYDIMIIITSV